MKLLRHYQAFDFYRDRHDKEMEESVSMIGRGAVYALLILGSAYLLWWGLK